MEITNKTLKRFWRFLPAQQICEERTLESGELLNVRNCANLTHFALMVNSIMCDMMQGECEFSPDIEMAIAVLEGEQATLAGLVKKV